MADSDTSWKQQYRPDTDTDTRIGAALGLLYIWFRVILNDVMQLAMLKDFYKSCMLNANPGLGLLQ